MSTDLLFPEDEDLTSEEAGAAGPAEDPEAQGSEDGDGLSIEDRLELMAKRQRELEQENARLSGELASRYRQPEGQTDTAAASGYAPPQDNSADIEAFAEQLGLEKEDLDQFVRAIEGRVTQTATRQAQETAQLLVALTQRTEQFFRDYSHLRDHRSYVDSIMQRYMADPGLLKGRHAYSDEVLDEVAKQATEGLGMKWKGKGQNLRTTKDPKQAHVATSGTGRRPSPAPKAEPSDPAKEWMDGFANHREKAMNPLAGVKTR